MKCPICKHGNTHAGTSSLTLERGNSTVVFKRVPAEVCENCGEVFYDATVTSTLLKQADQAASAGVEIDVRRYAAA
ncbi:MAG: type II toxin-antitoxin system MqsA family antitoxin [Nitrosomonadales bacterium]|nr:type II toxin-antitoxin system MqsA family antitoxin [Nitrosomonadales bacterium]